MAAVLANPIARRLLRIPPSYFVFIVLLATLWIARPNMLNLNIMGIFVGRSCRSASWCWGSSSSCG